MSAKGSGGGRLGGKEASPAIIIGAVVVLVVFLAAGGFYAYNGGWKTQGQLEDEGKHNSVPLQAAKHGNMAPLEAENKLRKERGEPLLELPKDRRQNATDSADQLAKLRQQLESKQGAPQGQ